MEAFDQVLEQYTPMIYSVLKRAKVYKNHEYYRHCATIALWEAWRKYDPTCGPFAPFAYRYMLTTIYREMTKENHYAEHHASYEKETLMFLIQKQQSQDARPDSELFEKLEGLVTKEEMELLMDLYYDRYKYEELQEKYGISASAIKKRRDRLMKRLREALLGET